MIGGSILRVQSSESRQHSHRASDWEVANWQVLNLEVPDLGMCLHEAMTAGMITH